MRNAGIYPTPHRARPPLSFGHAATLLLFDFGLFWLLLFCAALLDVHFRTGPLHTLARLVALAAFVEAIWSVVALIIGLTRSPAAPAGQPAIDQRLTKIATDYGLDPERVARDVARNRAAVDLQIAQSDSLGKRTLKPGGIGIWLMILGCAGLTCFGIQLLFATAPTGHGFVAGLVIAIPCGFAVIRLFFARPTIHLGPDAITLSQFGRTTSYQWTDITWLNTVSGRYGSFPHVGFKASNSFFSQLLLANYGMSSDALLGLLQHYRQAAVRNNAY